jgi:hypothetical protein
MVLAPIPPTIDRTIAAAEIKETINNNPSILLAVIY